MASASRDDLLKVCEETLVPLVQADGGEVWLVAADTDEVVLHLAGTCAGCPGATLTSKHVIEPALKAVSPSVRVVVTSGIRIPPGAKRLTG
jgi:Fe-S cluster biogenesis protein NfuA